MSESMHVVYVGIKAVIFGTLFVLLWTWLAVEAHVFGVTTGFVLPAWSVPLGVALAALGAGIAVTCVSTFVVKGDGTPAPFDAPRRLVAAGPYQVIRNPMYVGGITIIAGLALAMRSAGVLVLAGLFFLAAHLMVVLYEEPTLRRTFDGDYERYCLDVPRWLPRFR
jgi:protein-S-isoprenylcysteine O-methyltransferase Ste14